MTHDLSTLQQLHDRRVRMRFDDGHEVVALLLSASEDGVGSQHLLYNAVEQTNQAETYGGGPSTCYYAEARTLVSIEPAGDLRAGTS